MKLYPCKANKHEVVDRRVSCIGQIAGNSIQSILEDRMRLCVITGDSEYLYIHVTNHGGEIDPSDHTLSVRVMARWQTNAGGSTHAELRFEGGLCKRSMLPNSNVDIPRSQNIIAPWSRDAQRKFRRPRGEAEPDSVVHPRGTLNPPLGQHENYAHYRTPDIGKSFGHLWPAGPKSQAESIEALRDSKERIQISRPGMRI